MITYDGERIPPRHDWGLGGPGYKELDSGVFVPEADAYEYAVERLTHDMDLREEFVEWFYSGNWIKEE